MSLEVSVAYVGLRGMGGVMSVVTLAVLARAFGPSNYAEVAVAVAGALLLAAVVFGPLRAALARFSDGRELDRAALANLFFRAVVAVVLFGSALAAARPDRAELILAATALATMQGAFDYAVQDATSSFEPRRVGLLYLSKSALALAGAIVVLWLGTPAWCAVAWLALSGAFAIGLFGRSAFYYAWQSIERFPKERVRDLTAFALPLAVVGGLIFCAQWADRAVVGAILGARSFGAYVAIADLTQQLIGMLFSGVAAAWYPRLVQASGADDRAEVRRLFDRYVELLWVLLVPAVVGLAVVAPSLASVVFGPDFQVESGVWIPLLALGAGFAGMKAFLLDLPLFLRKQMILHAAIVGAAAVMSTGIAMVLVPRFAVQGAALAYGLATLTGCVLSLMAVRGFARLVPGRRTFLGVLAGCVALATASLSIVGPTAAKLILAIGAGAAAHVTALWILDVSDTRSVARRMSVLIRPLFRQ